MAQVNCYLGEMQLERFMVAGYSTFILNAFLIYFSKNHGYQHRIYAVLVFLWFVKYPST